MTDVDALLARFIEQWNGGGRPAVEDFLDQAPETGRDDLAGHISTFLALAPTPRYDSQTIDELLNAPAVETAAQAFASQPGAWPILLPRLRAQGGLSLRDLASRVLAAAGLGDHGVDKAEQRLSAMERGELDTTSVSTRVIDVLARILCVDSADLARTGTPFAAHGAGTLHRRGTDHDVVIGLDLLADALAAPVPEGNWDEVDELFFGGC